MKFLVTGHNNFQLLVAAAAIVIFVVVASCGVEGAASHRRASCLDLGAQQILTKAMARLVVTKDPSLHRIINSISPPFRLVSKLPRSLRKMLCARNWNFAVFFTARTWTVYPFHNYYLSNFPTGKTTPSRWRRFFTAYFISVRHPSLHGQLSVQPSLPRLRQRPWPPRAPNIRQVLRPQHQRQQRQQEPRRRHRHHPRRRRRIPPAQLPRLKQVHRRRRCCHLPTSKWPAWIIWRRFLQATVVSRKG